MDWHVFSHEFCKAALLGWWGAASPGFWVPPRHVLAQAENLQTIKWSISLQCVLLIHLAACHLEIPILIQWVQARWHQRVQCGPWHRKLQEADCRSKFWSLVRHETDSSRSMQIPLRVPRWSHESHRLSSGSSGAVTGVAETRWTQWNALANSYLVATYHRLIAIRWY